MDCQMERPSGFSLGPGKAALAISSYSFLPRIVPVSLVLKAYSSWVPCRGFQLDSEVEGGAVGSTGRTALPVNILRPKCRLFVICQAL